MFIYYSFQTVESENQEESVGEISVQIDLYSHPGTGEYKVNVKGKNVKAMCFLTNF